LQTEYRHGGDQVRRPVADKEIESKESPDNSGDYVHHNNRDQAAGILVVAEEHGETKQREDDQAGYRYEVPADVRADLSRVDFIRVTRSYTCRRSAVSQSVDERTPFKTWQISAAIGLKKDWIVFNKFHQKTPLILYRNINIG
jgi:hypothetical protein